MLALVLALASSLSYGVGDFTAGLKARSISLWSVLIITQISGMLLMLLIVAARGAPFPSRILLPAVGGGLLMVVFSAAYYRALSIGVMGIVGPVVSLSVAVPVIVGFVGGERPSALQSAGIACAVAGVLLASRERTADESARSTSRASVGLALLAAAAYGFAMVLYSHCAKSDPYWGIAISRTTSVVVFVAAFAIVRPPLDARRKDLVPLMISGSLGVSGFTLFSLASTLAYLSIASVLSSLYPVFIAVLAYVFLRERLAQTQLVGVVATLTGVGLIAAG